MTTNQSTSRRVDRRTVLAGAATFAGTLGAPAIVRAAPADVSVGTILPLTGAGAGYGQAAWNGVQAGCDYVNAHGGVKALGGAKLAPIVGDSENKPEIAANQVENLSRRGVAVLIGCAQSAATIVASQQAERLGIAILTVNDADPIITNRGFKYTFRTTPLIDNYAVDLLGYIKSIADKSAHPAKRVAILCENSIVGLSGLKAATETAKKLGLDVVDSSSYEKGQTQNFDTYVAKYKAANVEVFICQQNEPSDGVAIVRAMKELGYNPAAFGSILGVAGTQVFLTNLGADASGILTTGTWTDTLQIPGMQQVVADFKTKYGKQMDVSAMVGFADVAIVWDALERSKSADRKAVRDALAASDIKLGEHGYFMLNGVKFDAKGDNTKAAGLVSVIRDNSWVAVAPSNVAQGAAAYPKPNWS